VAGRKKDEPQEPQPGVAGMAQGQPAAGVEPDEHEDLEGPVTGGEVIAENQQNPDLPDNTGAHP
jgi:hypothetical protein